MKFFGVGWMLIALALVFGACSGGGAEEEQPQDVSTDSVAADRTCIPDCEGRQCGDDGCSGSCGTCGRQETCVAGVCTTGECPEGPCDDGDPCTHSDSCTDGECKGLPYVCEDQKECTSDECDGEGNCLFDILPNRCLVNGICYEAGQTHGSNPCKECMPTVEQSSWSADDSNQCDDGNACLSGEYCDGGECVAGTENEACDDGNSCTQDSCDVDSGCIYEPLQGACDDENSCTNDDQCVDGECVGVEVDCTDGDPCTDDSCDPVTGCTYGPNQEPCDDGNVCTEGDVCVDGQCDGGPQQLPCDDGDVCTTDSCDPATGCQHEFNTAPCDDGNECTDSDSCDQGQCLGQVKNCDDDNVCTADSCDPLSPGGCIFPPKEGSCDDGDPCATDDYCDQGECQAGQQQLSCDDGNPCTDDTCVPVEGCKYVNKVDLCDDGDACTQGDFCANGSCFPGGNICACQVDVDCAAQEDGNLCNGTLECDTSPQDVSDWECVVEPGTQIVCPDQNDTECSQAQCQPETGQCMPAAVNQGGSCDDNSVCTTSSVCDTGSCEGLAYLDCDDQEECTTDSCLPAAGCEHAVAFDGVPCGQGDSVCLNGKCTLCSCQAKQCGDDGCGHSCGSCDAEWLACEDNQCIEPCPDFSGPHVVPFWEQYQGLCWGDTYETNLGVNLVTVSKEAGKYEVLPADLGAEAPDILNYISCSLDSHQCNIVCTCDSECTVAYFDARAAYLDYEPWVSGGSVDFSLAMVDGTMELEASYSLFGPFGTCELEWNPATAEFGDKGDCEMCSGGSWLSSLACSPEHICIFYSQSTLTGTCKPLCEQDSDCAPTDFCEYDFFCWPYPDLSQDVCYEGDVWKQDPCGVHNEMADDCQPWETCIAGECL